MASIGAQSSPASFAPLAYPGDIVYLVYMLARLPGLSESVCCLLLSWQKEEKKVYSEASSVGTVRSHLF